ncbi:MAG: DUF2497 domain-containing protein [Alphaproteobacteria bacterium]|nr:DUF2497 domain-containing protein [Alphaproteobacteria bacterium]
MAEKQPTDEEPSIEEILDSIRQIISDDDEGGEPGDSQDDVLELTDKLEDPSVPAPGEAAPVATPVPKAPVLPEPVEIEMRDVEKPATPPSPPEPPKAKASSPPPPPPTPSAPSDRAQESIMTDRAENAAFAGFVELAKKTSIEYGGITLEEIVRTELNPLLRDWLDKHLPSLIDRLVREELDRIAKRAMGE